MIGFVRVKVTNVHLPDVSIFLLGIISSEMHGVPCSRNRFTGGCLESANSWFDDLSDFVWAFPVSPKLVGIQLLGVFKHFA